MSYWGAETTDRGVVVAAYTDAPMNYFVGEGVEEPAALLPTWRATSVPGDPS
ncbi:MAG TPA: hypothetical protein VN522_03270 [Solirubrobacterales bacterium]|nr:hypothetical protein [Solirubrobacterales bacterium]